MSETQAKECQDILGVCASFQLRKAARITTNTFNDILKPTGLRSTQVAVLLGAGAHPDHSISSLADKLCLDVSTLQRSLTVLQKHGLVHLAKGHQREKKVSLTQNGLEKRPRQNPTGKPRKKNSSAPSAMMNGSDSCRPPASSATARPIADTGATAPRHLF